MAKNIVPYVIFKLQEEKIDLLTTLKLSIISGISGLDIKGTSAASSLYSNIGIQMESYSLFTIQESAQIYYKELISKLNCPTPVFHWKKFISMVCANKKLKIVWFTDDYIESIFDLFFISKFLDEYLNVELIEVPKNGNYGNDISWADVIDLLK
jgi:uncharacterized protein with ATP-grasp and redox domains